MIPLFSDCNLRNNSLKVFRSYGTSLSFLVSLFFCLSHNIFVALREKYPVSYFSFMMATYEKIP